MKTLSRLIRWILFLAVCLTAGTLAALVVGGPMVYGQASLLPAVEQAFTNNNGTPLAGGFICTTISGTSTNLATYPTAADANALTNANQNPVRLNASGRPVSGNTEIGIWIAAGAYRITVYAAGTGNTCNGTAVGTAIKTVDGITGITTNINAITINGVQMCDQYPGATAGAKIAACIAALPVTGGTADAVGIQGAQAWSSCPLTGLTKPVTLLLGAATTTLSTNCAVPSSVTIEFSKGAIIAPTITNSLTFLGSIVAPPQQIFGGAGSVIFSSGARTYNIYPEWWGATGDGSTNNASAFQSAITAAPERTRILLSSGIYNISSTLSLLNKKGITISGPSTCDYASDTCSATLVYTAASGSLFDFDGANAIEIMDLGMIYSNAGYSGTFLSLVGNMGSSDIAFIHIHDARIGGKSTSSNTGLCIDIDGADNVDINHDFFEGCSNHIRAGASSFINRLGITYNWFDKRTGYAVIVGGNAIDVSQNIFEPLNGNGTALKCLDLTTAGASALSFNNNLLTDGEASAPTAIEVNLGYTVNGFSAHGNWIFDGLTAFNLGSAVGVDISGNYMAGLTNGIVASVAADVIAAQNSYATVTNQIVGNPTGNSWIAGTNAILSVHKATGGAQTGSLWIDSSGVINVGSQTPGSVIYVMAGTSATSRMATINGTTGNWGIGHTYEASSRLYLFKSDGLGQLLFGTDDYNWRIGQFADEDAFRIRTLTNNREFAMFTEGRAQTTPVTFATLTACSSGLRGSWATVTDSSTVTWGATITGSSSNTVFAFCNGVDWTVAGK